ncbi:MAG: hypothetical protein ABI690_11560 [Chloroflexota bacterium]
MAQQNLKLITVSSQAAESTGTQDIKQLLEENLKQQYDFATKRFQTALLYSILATVGVVIALIVFTGLNAFNVRHLPDQYRLYISFYEWRTEGVAQTPICIWSCEILTQSTRLLTDASDIGASMFATDDQGSVIGNIAGIARLCTLIAVFFAVWFSYRKQVLTRYDLNGQTAQRQDFETMPRWQFWLTRGLYTLASLFGTYVVVSVVWLGVGAMFKNMNLDWFNAALLIVLFTGATTLIATYGALAVTTREILLLGLLIFVTGFSASFALSPLVRKQEWWQLAVSSAGEFNPSAPLFTGTLLSGSLALVVMWFDIDSILQKMIADGGIRYLSAAQWMWVARILYIMPVVGLIFVGFVRVDPDQYRINMVFHAGGATLAILGAIVSALLIRKRRFHPWYKIFSVYLLFGTTIVMGLLGSLQLNPIAFGPVGDGLVSLTVIELTLFLLIGVWMYVTVDNLLGQANINAFDGPLLVMARKDFDT